MGRVGWIAAALLITQAALLSGEAIVKSAAWDEVAHLSAGLAGWEFGRWDLYAVNPPLVRGWATWPVLLSNPRTDWREYQPAPWRRTEFFVGRDFFKANGPRSFQLLSLSRFACIPLALLGGYTVFRWARELYGEQSAMLALALWCFSPNLLAHGAFITPDMGATALGVFAGYRFWNWLRQPTWRQACWAGLALGAAELTKFTWVILFVLWPALWMIHTGAVWRLRFTRAELGQLACILLGGLYVINLGYGFDGSLKKLGDYGFVSEALGGPGGDVSTENPTRNRFRDSWIGELRVPLPEDYLLGIDVQRYDFEHKFWSYLNGRWKFGGWWYFYGYALLLKEPLGTWLLMGLAALCGACFRGYTARWRDELVLLAPLFCILTLVSSQTGFSHHLRYVLPIFPFVFIWTSKVALAWCRCDRSSADDTEPRPAAFASSWGGVSDFVKSRRNPLVATIAALSLTWSIASSLAIYPNCVSYFNELAGGPRHGHLYLGSSCTDWGQDLFLLKQWHDQHPAARPLFVAYEIPLIDPSLVGIESQAVPFGPEYKNAATLPQESLGPRAGWYVLSINKLRTVNEEYTYLKQFEPVDRVGYSFVVFHITPEAAAEYRAEGRLPLRQ